MVEVGMLISK
jgi:hypothetical protein